METIFIRNVLNVIIYTCFIYAYRRVLQDTSGSPYLSRNIRKKIDGARSPPLEVEGNQLVLAGSSAITSTNRKNFHPVVRVSLYFQCILNVSFEI